MYRSLDPGKTIDTLRTLSQRIDERFPGASLNRVCVELLTIAEETTGRIDWLSRRHNGIRVAIFVVLGMAIYLGRLIVHHLNFRNDGKFTIEELDAATNALVLIGAALLFLFTLESRLKRARVLKALHELRALSHVIDMHQLTKDPSQVVVGVGNRTRSSPQRTLTPYQLTRYLDYCTEMLSLVGKLAALHAQKTSDSVVLQAVNDIEQLTNGISRKIWQKIMILDDDLKPENEAAVSLSLPMESPDLPVLPENGALQGRPVTNPQGGRRPISEPDK